MKNIAVVLRGHVRTWHFNAPKVFEFYNSIADNVDYYFITWDTSNTDGIEETFKDQNLIHFQIVSHSFENAILTDGDFKGKWYNGQLGPPYMNMMIMPHLRRREKQLETKYDCIFDTRPDILPVREYIIKGDDAGDPISFLPPEKNSIYVTGLEIQLNLTEHHKDIEDIAIQDWLLFMDSDTYLTWSMRYHDDNWLYEIGSGPGVQIELREYITENNLNLCINDWLNAYMMRPNCFQLDWLDSKTTSAMISQNSKWPLLERDEKIEICERYGISLSDYVDTPSITCKI